MLLYSPRDPALHEFFIENDAPSAPELRAVHTFFTRQPANGGVTPEELAGATGLAPIKLRVALEQLRAAGAVRRAPDEAYGRLRVEALPLTEPALQAVARRVAERREHKRDQLARMVDYAQTEGCRRRTVLDHFGDSGLADAVLCCDNCLAAAEAPAAPDRPAETQAERGALIVLDTVARLGWNVGKAKLAHLLKGSTGQDMAPYSQARNFGKFAVLRLSEIEGLIGQLVDAGYLKHVGAQRPTLKLTARGENALRARATIQVDLRPVRPAAARRAQAQRAAGGTVALSGQMLTRGLAPQQIAAERGLTLGTIYSHLAQLISEGRADVNTVVPPAEQAQIRKAIETVGTVEFLAPIKALLPAEMDYGVIRCVAEAWKHEHNTPNTTPAFTAAANGMPLAQADMPFQALRRWRHARADQLGQPDFVVFSDETLRRLAKQRPASKAELLSFAGLDRDVVERYGDEIVTAICSHNSAEVSNAILECVRQLPGQLPRSGVAKVLVGSLSERVEQYAAHPLYNSLPGQNRIEVTMQVDELLAAGRLAQDERGYLISG